MPFDLSVPRWPDELRPKDISDPQIINPTLDGPQPLIGAPQSVMSDAGLWQLKMIDIPVYSMIGGPDLLAIWRAVFTGRLQQGKAIYMPFRDWARGPVARSGLPIAPPVAGFSDGSLFSDGSGFSTAYQDVTVHAAAEQFDTAITVNVESAIANLGGTPIAGDFFSIAGRAHLIVEAGKVEGEANRWTWTIMPPLREDVAAGDVVEIRDPVCKMVLLPEDRRKIALTRDTGILARGTLTFIESNWV